jgi:DNA-binding NtrC family response regulator
MAVLARFPVAGESEFPPDDVLFGRSAGMQSLRRHLERVALTNVPVLVSGESGTGKDIIARMVHRLSPWANCPLVIINCAAHPPFFLQSELFATGEHKPVRLSTSPPGLGPTSPRGTLFLDEVSEIELPFQSSLVEFLRDGRSRNLDPQPGHRLEVRIVCTTNRHLEQLVDRGAFRRDLYHRISVVNLHLLPLRERAVDLENLVHYFVALYNREYHCHADPVSAELMAVLHQSHWPGNIRELENFVKRYVILGNTPSSPVHPSPSEPVPKTIDLDAKVPLKQLVRQHTREFERKTILKYLEANHWNRKRTAHDLGISYRSLLYKMQSIGLTTPDLTTPDCSAPHRSNPRHPPNS